MYIIFGFDAIKDFFEFLDPQGLLPLKGRIPEFEQFIQRANYVPTARPVLRQGGRDSSLNVDGASPERASAKKKQPFRKLKPRLKPCQFCGIQEEALQAPEKMDLHYVIGCLMLCNCNACGQIIEV